MHKGKKGFTLIELIIVVVIIGILAMVAIPRYFINIKKSQRGAAVTTLGAIRDAIMAYNAANSILPAVSAGSAIIVTVDGDQVMNTMVPTGYTFTNPTLGTATGTGGCSYTMDVGSGAVLPTTTC